MNAHSHDDVGRFLSEVKQAVDAGVALGEMQTMALHDGFVLGMYWRARGLLEGVVVLLAARLPDEALILTRSLLEESFRLQELAAAGDARAALVLGWYSNSLAEKKGLIRGAAARGYAEDVGLTEEDLEEEVKKVQGYMDRHGIAKLRHFMALDAAAARFDRADELWVARIADELVHGSEVAHGSRRFALPDGAVGYNLRNDNAETAAWVASLAARSLIVARRSAGSIFGWSGDDPLDALLARIDAYIGQEASLVPDAP
jgi:hypothetical protein